MEKDTGRAFWSLLLYPDVFNFLMFCTCELGSKDLSDNKISEIYSYYKSWWLHPSQNFNLSGSKCCLIRGEYRKSHSVKDPFHKLWIILGKIAKIRTCYWLSMAGRAGKIRHTLLTFANCASEVVSRRMKYCVHKIFIYIYIYSYLYLCDKFSKRQTIKVQL